MAEPTFNIIPARLIAPLKAMLTDSSRTSGVAIVCHMTPDGDAMGSSLGLWNTLRHMGVRATVITPDAPPANLMFLPGADEILIASYHPERARIFMRNASLVVCLDFNHPDRIGRLQEALAAAPAPKILIDHHLNPLIEVDFEISRPGVSSTCALLFMLLDRLGLSDHIDLDAATCICTGMMTDTGNFSYNSNDPRLYTILARLVEKGVDKDALYTRVFNTSTESRIRLLGFAQSQRMQLFPEHQCALITLSLGELNEFGYRRGDTESLVNIPLSIPGITYSIFLREDEPDYVKVSMRSKGDFSVKTICETFFNGGGHMNAAGGEVRDSLDQAVSRVFGIFPHADAMLHASGPSSGASAPEKPDD